MPKTHSPVKSGTHSTPVNLPNQVIMLWRYHDLSVIRAGLYAMKKAYSRHGNARWSPFKFSQRELEKAGVRRRNVKKALSQLIEAGFLECVRPGRPDQKGQRRQTAQYIIPQAKNPKAPWTINPNEFNGFLPVTKGYTPFPSWFWDVVRTESRAVVAVVGTVIRQASGRHPGVHISPRQFLQEAHIADRRTLNKVIRQAREKGYVAEDKAGSATPRELYRYRIGTDPQITTRERGMTRVSAPSSGKKSRCAGPFGESGPNRPKTERTDPQITSPTDPQITTREHGPIIDARQSSGYPRPNQGYQTSDGRPRDARVSQPERARKTKETVNQPEILDPPQGEPETRTGAPSASSNLEYVAPIDSGLALSKRQRRATERKRGASLLRAIGVNPNYAKRLAWKYSLDRIEDCVSRAKYRRRIRNRAAWACAALAGNWDLDEPSPHMRESLNRGAPLERWSA